MAKYVSIVERRVATTKGVTLVFKPMEPLEVHPTIEEDVIAAGIVREDLFKAAMSGQLLPSEAAAIDTQIKQQQLEAAETADEPLPETFNDEDNFDSIVAEMMRAKLEEDEKAKALAQAEKSPEFNQAVFETAVREIIARNNSDDLTPKGAPKAKVLSDLVGFEVKAIQITNFLRNLE